MELLGFKPKYITFDCYGTLSDLTGVPGLLGL
jgi:FMN phosphatase YigB (HAD superfamily)